MDAFYPDIRRHPVARTGDERYMGGGITMATEPSVADDKPPADLQGEGLSFERDIQPLARRYFQGTFGAMRNPRQAAAAYDKASAGLKTAYVQNAQIRAIDEQSRNRRIDYETAVYSLESAREKARKEREMLTNLAPLQSELDSVLGLPDADDQRKELGRLGIRYAGVLATNPAANAAFNSARTGVVDKDKQYTVGHFMQANGPSSYLKEVEGRLGRKLNATDPLDITEAFDRIEKDRLTDAATKANNAARIKEVEDDRQNLEKALDYTDKIKFAKDPMDDTKTLDTLADPADEGVLDTLIARFATPEEQKAATTVRAKAALAKRIKTDRLTDRARRPLKPLPADTRTGTASLFR